jgi:hypothetical protein
MPAMLLGQGPLESEPPIPLTRHWFHVHASLGGCKLKTGAVYIRGHELTLQSRY